MKGRAGTLVNYPWLILDLLEWPSRYLLSLQAPATAAIALLSAAHIVSQFTEGIGRFSSPFSLVLL